MSAHRAVPRLIGEKVALSYLADPWVGYGRFRLENPGDAAMTANVQSAWLEQGKHHQPLAEVTVFDLGQERMLDPAGFQVEAGQTITFLLGFPRIRHESRPGESTAVGLRLRVDGSNTQAASPIELVRRLPPAR